MKKVIRKRNEDEPLIVKNGEPSIDFQARIGALVSFPVLEDQGEGYIERQFEKYVRAPGVRIIVVKDDRIYLQREKRIEIGGFDWRLPGGKVFDRFEQYKPFMDEEIPEEIIIAAAQKELQEEAGLEAQKWNIFSKFVCGTTVQWDLYYLVAQDPQELMQHVDHDEGEEVEEVRWFSFDEIERMCRAGEIQEGRTVMALLQFISKK